MPPPPPPPLPPALSEVEDPEEAAFQRLWGPWEPWTPQQAAEALESWDATWWIAGGWALEAFTGVPRRHEDIDVAVWRQDIPRLRTYLGPAYHCWAAGSGQLRPLSDDEPTLPEWSHQMWVREHAWAPWLIDVVATEDIGGAWVFRRDPSFTAPLPEVTWVAPDGIRYLNPEMVLAYKAKLTRPKDDADLAAALPRLETAAREWLRDTVRRLHPEHHWLSQL
ncbi:MAG: hypothetical protein H0V48_07755 [Nocardioidaceae bacterium]|nr:hypothetical protein [Nocardioidaceae bacterium]